MLVLMARAELLNRARPIALLLILGLALGLGLTTSKNQTVVSITSSVIGWAYFACWSLSFYPQLLLNIERQSVVGLSFDYAALNTVGFACYSAFNIALFCSASIRAEYAQAHSGHNSAVRINDVVFALHALVLSSLLLVQIALYPRGTQRFSRLCKGALALFALACPFGLLLVAQHQLTALQLLYGLSFVKLAITCAKYCPQVWLNMKRRSTEGWNMDNVYLDFSGGALSLGQLFLDALAIHDWSAVSGDPVKFGLGFISMAFDVVFMLQHWVCFRVRRVAAEPGLLGRGTSTSPFGTQPAAPLLQNMR